jgi:hypothetical protein
MKPRFFLACGTAAPLIFLGALLFGSAFYPGYSPLFQAVSELIAAGAPTKIALDLIFSLCSLLIALFSFGIYLNVNRAHGREARLAARLGSITLAAISLLGILILIFPMDPAGSNAALSDYSLRGKIHVALASLMSAGSLPAVLLIGFWLSRQPSFTGLARYSFITAGFLFAAGIITAAIYFGNQLWLGAFERLTFAIFLQWLLGTAWTLSRAELGPDHALRRSIPGSVFPLANGGKRSPGIF